jgi:hypothetical protein
LIHRITGDSVTPNQLPVDGGPTLTIGHGP